MYVEFSFDRYSQNNSKSWETSCENIFFKQTTFLGYHKEKLIYLNQDFLPHFTELQLGKGDLAYNEHDFK